MKHLKRVLCAVDIREPDREVFAYALAMARRSAASLLVVHAASPVRPLNEGATERVDFLRQLRAAAEAASVDTRVTVQRGDVAGVILLHAAARRPDLIVIGAGQHHGRRYRFSSIAERVVRGGPCPTLVVPEGPHSAAEPFENIVCAVDFSPASHAAVHHALRLAQRSERRLTLLHVVDGPGPDDHSQYPWLAAHEYYRSVGVTALEQLQALIPLRERALVLARVVVGSAVTEILRLAGTTDARLLVIGARPRSRIGRRLFGRTGLLLRRANCPVLAVPEPARAQAEDHEGRRKLAA